MFLFPASFLLATDAKASSEGLDSVGEPAASPQSLITEGQQQLVSKCIGLHPACEQRSLCSLNLLYNKETGPILEREALEKSPALQGGLIT